MHTRSAFLDYDDADNGAAIEGDSANGAEGGDAGASAGGANGSEGGDAGANAGGAKRHLLRMWVAPPRERGAWPLPDCFAQQYGSTEPGERGGIQIAGFTECVPLEAE